MTNYEPEEEYKEKIMIKKDKFQMLRKEKSGNCLIRRETLYMILSKFQRYKKRNYDFLVKAGKYFQTAVFHFF